VNAFVFRTIQPTVKRKEKQNEAEAE